MSGSDIRCGLTVSQKALVERTREYASSALSSKSEGNQTGFSRQAWQKYVASGVLAIAAPTEYGGKGETLSTAALAVRELARYAADEGLVFSLCADLTTCILPIVFFGTERQKRQFLPGLIDGTVIGGNAASELQAGSDLASMATTLLPATNGLLLNGSKNFSTNGSVADLLVVYARHPDGVRFANISALLVQKGDEGFTVRRDWDKMGLRTSPLSEIDFDNLCLPIDRYLGKPSRGLALFEKSMVWERIVMSAYLIGSMEQQFNLALNHARGRRQFDRRIVDFQSVSHRLVDMFRNIETASALLLSACQRYERGLNVSQTASLLKLHASDTRVSNSLSALSIFGAAGYMTNSAVERQIRDSLAAPIYSGTNDIQKNLIADAFVEYK